MAGHTTQEMIDMLGLRLEDETEDIFSAALKLMSLNWAQLEITGLVHLAYLDELEVKDFDIACALDTNDDEGSVAYTSLSAQPLSNGIQRVKIHDGAWAHMIKADDVRKSANTFSQGTNKRPLAYLQRERIYVAADADDVNVDIHYIREPETMVAQFTVASVASGVVISAPDLDAYYIELTFTAPGWAVDEFNGQVAYNKTKGKYFIIVDGTATVLKVVNQDETVLFEAGDVIYFASADGTLTNLTDASSELNPRLHGILVDLAEADLWKHDHKNDRSELAYNKAIGAITALNARYESEAPTGIGTGNRN